MTTINHFTHAIGIVLVLTAVSFSNDELSRTTWESPSHAAVQARIDSWLIETDVPLEVADTIRRAWSEPIDVTERLNLLAESFSSVDQDAADLAKFCFGLHRGSELPSFDVLVNPDTNAFMRDHLKLLYARWLAQHKLYNETLEQIEYFDTDTVVDPASMLFYKAVAYHHLLRKAECLPVVEQLLEQDATLPKRFTALVTLARADIEQLEVDSLDEISRIMGNIGVRLGHGRAGKRVRKEEDDVIAKLDKMIKDLEEEQQKQQQSASASGKAGNSLNPSKPMQDSMPGGASGPGNVDPKDIGKKAGWGDLPPKERQQALQQLGKEFPSHYRDVIQEYFRKLAAEGADR